VLPFFCARSSVEEPRSSKPLVAGSNPAGRIKVARAMWQLIDRIAARDGYKCVWCSRLMRINGVWAEDTTLDHLMPKAYGGRNHQINMVISCASCNNLRGCKSVHKFIVVCEETGRQYNENLIMFRYRAALRRHLSRSSN
jgi:hypothetical protein